MTEKGLLSQTTTALEEAKNLETQSNEASSAALAEAICMEIAGLRNGIQESFGAEVEFFRKLSVIVLAGSVVAYLALLAVLLHIAGKLG